MEECHDNKMRVFFLKGNSCGSSDMWMWYPINTLHEGFTTNRTTGLQNVGVPSQTEQLMELISMCESFYPGVEILLKITLDITLDSWHYILHVIALFLYLSVCHFKWLFFLSLKYPIMPYLVLYLTSYFRFFLYSTSQKVTHHISSSTPHFLSLTVTFIPMYALYWH